MIDHRALSQLADEADYLATFARSSVDPSAMEDLIDRYLAFRDSSAAAMRVLTDKFLARDEWALDRALEQIESELRSRLAGVFPLDAVVLRKYSDTHRKLYEYLYLTRRPVSASRLRVLTGDQVHTERRIRELRDIGLRIDATHQSGQNSYELVNTAPDFEQAMVRLVPEFLKRIPSWSAARPSEALRQLGLS
jgi:hypothetical protein